MTSFAVPYYNTETPLVGKTAYLQRKSFSDIQYKTLCQPTTTHSYLSGNAPLPQLRNNDRIPYNHLLPFITLMLTHCLTSMLDHMLLFRTHKPRPGISTVLLQRSVHSDATTSRPRGGEYWFVIADSYADVYQHRFPLVCYNLNPTHMNHRPYEGHPVTKDPPED